MTARKLGALFAALLSIVVLLLAALAPPAGAAGIAEPLAAVIEAAHFPELLVKTRPTNAAEDEALVRALRLYQDRTSPDDFSSLTAFLATYPHSGWAPALLTNLGLSYLHYGYFSRALDAWQRAWHEGKNATEPHARALVDGAVGQLARLYASLGDVERLAALFEEIGGRRVTGSATEWVQTAAEQLSLARTDTRHLFICGPMALRSLMLARGARSEEVSSLQWYRARSNGTNLAEVAHLADQKKVPYRLVFRQPGQTVPMPAIVHWKVGHFAAIVGQANGRFRVQDPVFPGRELWVTPAALDQEATGYFLVPTDGANDASWRTVDDAEAATVWGKGQTTQTAPGDAGDPTANPNGGSPPRTPGAQPVAGTGADGGDQGSNSGQSGNSGSPGTCPGGMCGYNIKEASVSLALSDTPVGFVSPVGPSTKVQITYSQREDSQPQNFSYFNVSPKWTFNWLGFVQDDPNNPGATVTRYLPGGGAYYYSGYNNSTGQFAPETTDGSVLVLSSQTPVSYQRLLRNGWVEVYSLSDGSTSSSLLRKVFLTQLIDAQGNAVTLNYDSRKRLTSLTDATGRQTTFTYGTSESSLLVTQITDPFGRSATLSYDYIGRLISITDVLGLTSSFTYDANSLVNSMTTPYGTTTFAYDQPGAACPSGLVTCRFLQITDPLGYNEREEWVEWPSVNSAPIPDSDPAGTVPQGPPAATPPQGMPLNPTNQYLTYRNSFHWDKNAYIVAGCTPAPPTAANNNCDYTKARTRHFAHVFNNNPTTTKSTTIESVKYPLENRIWYQYPDQTDTFDAGIFNKPIAIGRALVNGSSAPTTTQFKFFSYDTGHYSNLTQAADPIGRMTQFSYDPNNNIDLTKITQTVIGSPPWGLVQWQNFTWTASGSPQTFTSAQFTYNTCSAPHRPCTYTDAAGQTTTYAYNSAGQLTSVTNPLNQTTSYQYDTSSNPTSITNANGVTAASLTYNGFARVRTYTDSEGWTATYDYDPADRVTKITYPDGTTSVYAYDKLDLASFQDRQGRVWTYTHDANRRLTGITDPLGSQTLFGYNGINELTSLTDPKGTTTSWTYDVEGRLTTKQYADGSTLNYTYESTTSRLLSVSEEDPNGNVVQTKQYTYAVDDRISDVSYPAGPTTPTVSFTYDATFPRRTSMTDGTGTTNYTYIAPGSLGALRLYQETSPLASSTITYAYDALGRLTSRTVAGAGAENFGYDAIGRLTSDANDLGSFALNYLGQTGQIAQRQLVLSSLSTAWGYLPNSGDRRLASIRNTGLASSQFSNYTFTTTAENFISQIGETSDTATAYPTTSTQTASYNALNQLTNLSGQGLSYDANGNLASDGARNYAWDAENRLVTITYPSQPGKQTAFTYDGLGRRTAIASTPPGGGSTVTTSYLWCGSRICQARNASNAVAREYYGEGEYVPGTPAQAYYYGPDQLGSVRRAFASTSSAPAYAYDPYGQPLQGTAPVTDFNYAGMFYNADSGLYLTQYRAYDPVAGRWLSRDPIGEIGDPARNLYGYVASNTIGSRDPMGLCPTPPYSPSIAGSFVSALAAVVEGLGEAAEIVGTGSLSALAGLAAVLSLSGDTPQLQYVVRGGLSAPNTLQNGVDELTALGLPGQYGISSSSAPPPASVIEIATAANYPHPQITYSTTQQLNAAGYQVVATPTSGNPLHSSILLPPGMTSLTNAQAAGLSGLFTPDKNPAFGPP